MNGVVAGAQRTADRVVGWLILRAIPHWVHPNHLAGIRLLLCPVVAVLYGAGFRWWAVVAFLAAAALDLIDGALARTRNQCTRLGLFLDPLADKLLIATMLAVAGWQYLVVKVLLAVIGLELVALVVAAVANRRTDLLVSSNLLGKVKMWLQTLGLAVFLIGRIVGSQAAADFGAGMLWAALLFAAGAALISVRQAIGRWLAARRSG